MLLRFVVPSVRGVCSSCRPVPDGDPVISGPLIRDGQLSCNWGITSVAKVSIDAMARDRSREGMWNQPM